MADPEALETREGRQAGAEPNSLGRVPPAMLNEAQVNRALAQEYPTALKEAGIGGTTVVRIFIDEEGIVRDQVVRQVQSRANPRRAGAALDRDQRYFHAEVSAAMATWPVVGGSDIREQEA